MLNNRVRRLLSDKMVRQGQNHPDKNKLGFKGVTKEGQEQ